MSRERERGMFESVVVVAFQSVFHAELHQNDVFFIFKKLFLRSAHKNEPKHANFFFIFSKTKLNFLKTQVGLRFQMLSKKEEEEKSV